MADEKKIKFSAEDAISPFIKNLQKELSELSSSLGGKSKALYSDFIKIAQEQSKNAKDQLALTNQQITALEKKLQIEREYTKTVLERQREFAGEAQQDQIAEQLAKLKDKSVEDKMMIQNLRAEHRESTKTFKDQEASARDAKPSIFSEVFKAGLVRDLMGIFRQMPNAQTGLDLLTPTLGLTGATSGAITGSAIDAANISILGNKLGDIHASTTLSALGKELGQIAGTGITRHIQTQEKFQAAQYAVEGMTGQRSKAVSLNQFGMDLGASAQLEAQIIQATKQTATAEQIKNVAAISKFANIDQGTILGLLGTTRMGANVNEERIIGLFKDGVDRSVLSDMTQNLTSIITKFGESRATPDALMASQMMMEFNKIGGPFAIGDPRSAGLMSQYHDRFSNPSGNFAQALSYSVAREQRPDMDPYQLMEYVQEANQEYKGGVMDKIGNMSGNPMFNMLMFSQLFGTGKRNIDRAFWEGDAMGSLAGTSTTTGLGGTTQAELFGGAANLTTTMQKHMAEATDAFAQSFIDGMKMLATQLSDRIIAEKDKFIEEGLDTEGNKLKAKDSNPPKNDTAGDKLDRAADKLSDWADKLNWRGMGGRGGKN